MVGTAVMVQEELQKHIFYDIETGIAACLLYISGRWTVTVIDDQLPSKLSKAAGREGTPYCIYGENVDSATAWSSGASAQVSVWFPLLEKGAMPPAPPLAP